MTLEEAKELKRGDVLFGALQHGDITGPAFITITSNNPPNVMYGRCQSCCGLVAVLAPMQWSIVRRKGNDTR